MKVYPRKCWCGVMLDTKWDENYHDCNAWEYILEEERQDELRTTT